MRQIEKEEDKDMVTRIIERERQQDELESKLREKERLEIMMYMNQNQKKTSDQKEHEKYVQSLVDIENEK